MKTSRWNRYDEKSGLWIASNKRIFIYWYKYLQHAENDPTRQVDWTKYDGWGGADVILNTRFDVWWKKNWKTLFGYRLNTTEPMYSLSTPKPQPDGVRYSLLVYELKDQHLHNGRIDKDVGKVGDYWEIAKRVAVLEYPRRKKSFEKDPNYPLDDWSFHYARPVIARKLKTTNPLELNKQRRTIQSRIGRYMRAAEKHLDNVCKGKFP